MLFMSVLNHLARNSFEDTKRGCLFVVIVGETWFFLIKISIITAELTVFDRDSIDMLWSFFSRKKIPPTEVLNCINRIVSSSVVTE